MDIFLNYQEFLEQLKKQIQTARINAVLSVNAQMLQLYWWIGNSILNQQKSEGWGAQVIKKIAVDLKSAFPDMKGISERNLKYMRAFASAYPSIVQVPLAQIETGNRNIINTNMQGKLEQITWYHHITLYEIGLTVQLDGFKRGGVKSFNWFGNLNFYLEKYKYQISPDRSVIWEEHLYDKEWNDADYQRVTEKWAELIIEEVSMSVENINPL